MMKEVYDFYIIPKRRTIMGNQKCDIAFVLHAFVLIYLFNHLFILLSLFSDKNLSFKSLKE